MKNQNFLRRFSFAIQGIVFAWQNEKSFRTQSLAAVLWLVVLFISEARAFWWAIFVLLMSIILAFELLNTSLERLADHLHPNQHPMIKIVKDCAAGGILMLSFCAIVLAVIYLVEVLSI